MTKAACTDHTITDARSLIPQASAPKKSALLAKIVMHCSRGPEDYSKVEAHAAEEPAGKRSNRRGLGLSIRVGCTVHLALRIQPDTPETAGTIYYNSEHSTACQVGCCTGNAC